MPGEAGGGGGDALSTHQFGCQNFFYFWRSEKCGAAEQPGIPVLSLLNTELEFFRNFRTENYE